MEGLPYRGSFGARRPAGLGALRLPPEPMPSHHGPRPLKAWRYVGAYGPELMLCLGLVRVGRARQSFWAVWDRTEHQLHERTLIGRREVSLARGRAAVRSARVQVELAFEESEGIETVSPSGRSYAWTRKQGGVRVHGTLTIDGTQHRVRARAVIDDSAGYHERHTHWRWCAGVGRSTEGRELAWNLVEGIHDSPQGSERTVWVDGEPQEVSPAAWDGLRFDAEAERARRDNLIIIRSSYRQPFGTFSGTLPGGLTLADAYGVMEEHDAWW